MAFVYTWREYLTNRHQGCGHFFKIPATATPKDASPQPRPQLPATARNSENFCIFQQKLVHFFFAKLWKTTKKYFAKAVSPSLSGSLVLVVVTRVYKHFVDFDANA